MSSSAIGLLQQGAAAKQHVCYKQQLARAQLSGKISARARLLIVSDAATSAVFSQVYVVKSLYHLFVSDSHCVFAPLHASSVPDSRRALKSLAWGPVMRQTYIKRLRMLSVYPIQTKVCLPLPRCVSHFTPHHNTRLLYHFAISFAKEMRFVGTLGPKLLL